MFLFFFRMSDFDVNVPFLSLFSCAVLGALIYVCMYIILHMYVYVTYVYIYIYLGGTERQLSHFGVYCVYIRVDVYKNMYTNMSSCVIFEQCFVRATPFGTFHEDLS